VTKHCRDGQVTDDIRSACPIPKDTNTHSEYVILVAFSTATMLARTHRNVTLYRVRKKRLTIWQHSCDWNRWRGEFVLECPSSETQSTSIAMECWSVEHRAFGVETYFWNNCSDVVTPRVYCWHFNIHRNDSVTRRNIVLLCVRNCRETASAAKRRRPGREPSLRTAKNNEGLIHAFVGSPPIAGMCWQQGTPTHRHYIQEVNIVIKMFWDKDNFSNKFT